MKLFIASDHAGFFMKNFLIENLKNDFPIINLGTESPDSCDYPIFAQKLIHSLLSIETTKKKSYDLVDNGSMNFGILICGSGIGMSIVANRHPKIRAALCLNKEMAIMSRKHNNANVIVLGARMTTEKKALLSVKAFISTEFEGGRHAKRLRIIDDLFIGGKP